MSKKITTSIETITPSIAKEWIEKYGNPKNRNISESVVINFARVMKNGGWRLNGEAIIFDSEGTLANGHHRLHAIIRAGTPVQVLVVRGVTEDAFATYDSGNKRTAGNVFQIADIPNSNGIASMVSQLIIYRAALLRGGSYNTYIRPTSEECLDVYNENSEIYQYAYKNAALSKKLTPPASVAMIYAYAMIDKRHNGQSVELFAERLSTGEMLHSGDPVLTLRNFLIKASQDKAKGKTVSANYIKNVIIKAWNAYIKGEKLRVLKLTDPNKAIKII